MSIISLLTLRFLYDWKVFFEGKIDKKNHSLRKIFKFKAKLFLFTFTYCHLVRKFCILKSNIFFHFNIIFIGNTFNYWVTNIMLTIIKICCTIHDKLLNRLDILHYFLPIEISVQNFNSKAYKNILHKP